MRAAVLIPWAIPTVVAALLWRFMFEGRGIANALLAWAGAEAPIWFIGQLAWVPVVLADVWKTTPFVALLLLAGLQNIDPSLYEAARIDGASAWRQFRHVTLPLLKPAILVALDLPHAGRLPGLRPDLRADRRRARARPPSRSRSTPSTRCCRTSASATARRSRCIVFLVTFALALGYIRLLGAGLTETRA